jgi:hypothetical protein
MRIQGGNGNGKPEAAETMARNLKTLFSCPRSSVPALHAAGRSMTQQADAADGVAPVPPRKTVRASSGGSGATRTVAGL